MVLSLLGKDGDWQVWVALEDSDPIAQHESFVIGVGDTKARAFTDAAKELEEAAGALVALALHNGVRMHGSHALDQALNESDGSYRP